MAEPFVLDARQNFCSGYLRKAPLPKLHEAGYRVGSRWIRWAFAKSSKPEHYQFSFHQLAANTRRCWKKLDVDKVTNSLIHIPLRPRSA